MDPSQNYGKYIPRQKEEMMITRHKMTRQSIKPEVCPANKDKEKAVQGNQYKQEKAACWHHLMHMDIKFVCHKG